MHRRAAPRKKEDLEQKLVLMLRHLYGDRISSTAVQILMAQVRIQVMTLFPGDYRSRFPKILEAAFPGSSARILATLANVDSFDRWLESVSRQLAALDAEARWQVGYACMGERRRQMELGADAVIMHGAAPTELAPILEAYRAEGARHRSSPAGSACRA